MKPRRPFDRNPLKRLVLEFRHAARGIAQPEVRRIAAREADAIPLTRAERFHARKGEFARIGRAIMRRMPDLAAEEFDEAAATLCHCAAALDGDLVTVSEVWLGQKRRHDHAAA